MRRAPLVAAPVCAWGRQMGLEIPPEWQWVAYLTGSEWPKGDETALFGMGNAWKGAAGQLNSLVPQLQKVADRTESAVSGATGDAAAEMFAPLLSGDGSLDK